MSASHKLVVLFLAVLGLSLACSLNPTPTVPTEDNEAVIQTAVAATTTAQQTEQAAANPPTEAPSPQPSDTPEPTQEPTPADVTAPNPLGPEYTGLIFDFDTCYDFDTYQPAPVGAASVDACLDQYGTLSFYNGARMSGYATFDPPSRNECIASALAPDNLAPNSDLYLCLQTSEGSYGFFVEREFQLDMSRFMFDLYLFP
ncbi:MAG: hypothetical protein P8046_01185 [Anaerolineales bacterium]